MTRRLRLTRMRDRATAQREAPDGNQHTCAGAGKTPLDGADGEAQG